MASALVRVATETKDLMSFIAEQLESRIGRRALLQWSSVATASLFGGGILAGCGGSNNNGGSSTPSGATTDAQILNFALNLEYLEAEYYLRAATGSGVDNTYAGAGTSTTGTGAGTVVTKNSSTVVPFSTPAIQNYAEEIASDEYNHVKFLRTALGSAAVARPNINLLDSFNAAANAAGLGSTFDPFANETNFLLGAFIFEDVGVTAYHGAAALITNKTYLTAAAGILAVEAYHAAAVRTSLLAAGAGSAANSISNARASLDGSGAGGNDQGLAVSDAGYSATAPLTAQSSTNLVPTDSNSIVFARTTAEVLRIVYLGSSPSATNSVAASFFPNGLNGAIK